METKGANQVWYRAYCVAMLETDLGRVLESVESARKAILDRASELSSVGSPESSELVRAMRFLNMLLHCAETDQSTASVLLTRDASTSSGRFANVTQ